MTSGRPLAVLAELDASAGPRTRGLCRLCAWAVEVSGAGLTLLIGDGSGPLCSSNPVSARIEELQYTLGEGPCVDAHNGGAPVLAPDLAGARPDRWPGFSPGALAAGAAAVFAFPLRVGAVRLGALTLYEDAAGPLSPQQHSDAIAVAEIAVHEILVAQAEAAPGDLASQLADLGTYRAEVHQAAGMVAVQLGVGVPDGLVRLRAHAFAAGLPLHEVAGDVVARRLRLAP